MIRRGTGRNKYKRRTFYIDDYTRRVIGRFARSRNITNSMALRALVRVLSTAQGGDELPGARASDRKLLRAAFNVAVVAETAADLEGLSLDRWLNRSKSKRSKKT